LTPPAQPLKKLMAADPTFWTPNAPIAWTVIIGDAALARGVTWTASSAATLAAASTYRRAATPTPGVFEFDLHVARVPLPEYEAPTPAPRRGPPAVLVAAAVAAAVAPFAAFAAAVVARPGAMAVVATAGADARADARPPVTPSTAAFVGCLLAVAAVLGRFWVGWRLTTTAGALALLAPPTMVAGYGALRSVAARPPRGGSALARPDAEALRSRKGH